MHMHAQAQSNSRAPDPFSGNTGLVPTFTTTQNFLSTTLHVYDQPFVCDTLLSVEVERGGGSAIVWRGKEGGSGQRGRGED